MQLPIAQNRGTAVKVVGVIHNGKWHKRHSVRNKDGLLFIFTDYTITTFRFLLKMIKPALFLVHTKWTNIKKKRRIHKT